MQGLQWNADLETGHELVDEQHRAIIGLINEFVDAQHAHCEPEQISAALVRLSDYVSTHFAEEERLMAHYGYAEDLMRVHRGEHLKLSERTRQLVLAHRTGQDDTACELVELMQEWLTEHIMQVDRRLVDHVRAVRSAAGT